METITITENTKNAVYAINQARDRVCVELSLDSCSNGNALELLAVAEALKNKDTITVARVNSIASIIAISGADEIEIADGAMILITPLKISTFGDIDEQKKSAIMLEKTSLEVSKALSRWPKAQNIFDAGEERFISKSDAYDMGIILYL